MSLLLYCSCHDGQVESLQLAGQSQDRAACHLGVRVTIGRHDRPNSHSIGVELDDHVVGIRLDTGDEVDVEANPQSSRFYRGLPPTSGLSVVDLVSLGYLLRGLRACGRNIREPQRKRSYQFRLRWGAISVQGRSPPHRPRLFPPGQEYYPSHSDHRSDGPQPWSLTES